MSDRWIKIAVALPVVGLLALVTRAEIAVRSGPTWRIVIRGYDPRDLLHGHYLRYQFDFNWEGTDTCGDLRSPRVPSAHCCLCLSRTNPDGVDPTVRQVDCSETEGCDGWLRASEVKGAQRYFVPEDRAGELERALRDREASLELTCGTDGRPAIRELYLDGQPWRQALRKGSTVY